MSDLPPAVLIPANADAARALRGRGVSVFGPATRAEPAARYCRPLAGVEPLKETADPGPELLDRVAALCPGAVFLAGGDGMALSLVRHASIARPLLHTSVSADSLYRLLNKRQLSEACREYNVPAFETVLLDTPAAVEQAARVLRFPALLKPQTRVGRNHWFRALVVSSPSELAAAVQRFWSVVGYAPDMLAFDPLVAHPIVQEYEPASVDGVYHLCGYVAASGTSAFRAHIKTLQYPRRFGNAICAEPAPVEPALRDAVVRLCRGVGYHGVLEVETVLSNGEYRVIDVNPRFYNGMSLELAAGLELPWFAYLDAVGDHARLDDALALAEADEARLSDAVFCRRVMFHLMVASQLASRGMTLAEARRWVRWYREHRDHMVDGVDYSDRGQWLRDAAATLWSLARDPRYFAGTFLRRP